VVIEARGVTEPLICDGETIVVKLHGALISYLERLSNHAVASTWLTEEFYSHGIQPLLRTKKVREIAQVI
jgi:hypothetical protein